MDNLTALVEPTVPPEIVERHLARAVSGEECQRGAYFEGIRCDAGDVLVDAHRLLGESRGVVGDDVRLAIGGAQEEEALADDAADGVSSTGDGNRSLDLHTIVSRQLSLTGGDVSPGAS